MVGTEFLDTDKALEALLAELKTLKSSTEQLQEAGKTSGRAVQSAEAVTELAAKVLSSSTKQTEAVAALAARMETLVETQLLPQVEATQRTARTNRWLIAFTLLLSAANVALAFLSYQLLAGGR